LLSISAHTLPVTGVAVLGDRVYSVSLDATLKVHDIGAGGQLVANVDVESAASAIAVTRTGGRIYVGRVDGTVICYSTFQLHQGPKHDEDQRSVVLTPDSTTKGHVSVTSLLLTTNETLLVAGTSDGQCIVLDAATLHEVRRHRDHVGGGGITHLAVTDLPPFELFSKRRGGAAQAPAPLRRFADPDPAHALANFQVPPQQPPQFI
jgi:WD40 repeat protein